MQCRNWIFEIPTMTGLMRIVVVCVVGGGVAGVIVIRVIPITTTGSTVRNCTGRVVIASIVVLNADTDRICFLFDQ